MTTLQPIYIQDIMKSVVDRVSAKLTPAFKLIDDSISAVHFDYGHPLEIIETLTQKSGTSMVYDKYPLVALFLDASVERGVEVGMYGEYDLHLAIVKGTVAEYKAYQRDELNFRPFLIPIYMELMNQLMFEKALQMPTDVSRIRHRMTERYYWGRQGLYGNEGNIFGDHVDAIEIERLKIKVNLNYCPK